MPADEMVGHGCGVTVFTEGRRGLTYREGTRHILIDAEMLGGGEYDYVVVAKSIRFWQESGEPIGESERARIIANIVAVGLDNEFRFEIEY